MEKEKRSDTLLLEEKNLKSVEWFMGQTKQREGEDELKMKSEQNHFKWMGAEDHFLVLESMINTE